jgi:hypothetical protein
MVSPLSYIQDIASSNLSAEVNENNDKTNTITIKSFFMEYMVKYKTI